MSAHEVYSVLGCVCQKGTNVSEGHSALIFRVKLSQRTVMFTSTGSEFVSGFFFRSGENMKCIYVLQLEYSIRINVRLLTLPSLCMYMCLIVAVLILL
jgi:hypothetical protein